MYLFKLLVYVLSSLYFLYNDLNTLTLCSVLFVLNLMILSELSVIKRFETFYTVFLSIIFLALAYFVNYNMLYLLSIYFFSKSNLRLSINLLFGIITTIISFTLIQSIQELIVLILLAILLIYTYYLFNSNNQLKQKLINYNGKINLLYEREQNQEDYYKVKQEYLILKDRNNISQALHDQIGHTLTGNMLQLHALKIMLQNRELDNALIKIDSINNSLNNGYLNIKNIIETIRPNDEILNISYVKRLLNELNTQSNFNVTLNVSGNTQQIPQNIWHVIIDNLREAITNLLKHSNGSQFNVNIRVLNNSIQVVIKDNGVVNSSINHSLGIKGMIERVLEVKGKINITKTFGFTINMLFELEGDIL